MESRVYLSGGRIRCLHVISGLLYQHRLRVHASTEEWEGATAVINASERQAAAVWAHSFGNIFEGKANGREKEGGGGGNANPCQINNQRVHAGVDGVTRENWEGGRRMIHVDKDKGTAVVLCYISLY